MRNCEMRPVWLLTRDAETRAVCEEQLRPLACKIYFAASAPEAVSQIQGAELAAAFLDFELLRDEKSPEALCQRLRQATRRAPLVILLDESEMERASAWLQGGVCDYLLKPLRPWSVRACVMRLQHLLQADWRAAQAEHLAALGQRMAVLTHEGRNILQLMQANLEMLRARIGDQPAALDYQEKLQRSQEHLQRMFDDLRGAATPFLIHRQSCDLGALLRQVAQRVARGAGREMRLVQAAPLPALRCAVDAFRMDQVFRNLLENSLEASREPVQVQVSWSETRLHGRPALQIRLRDNGPGLNAEQRAQLFTPFYTTKSSGTGLGMTIAQRIVEAHGGKLMIGETSGPGAEFLIVLPIQDEVAAPLGPDSGWPEATHALSEA